MEISYSTEQISLSWRHEVPRHSLWARPDPSGLLCTDRRRNEVSFSPLQGRPWPRHSRGFERFASPRNLFRLYFRDGHRTTPLSHDSPDDKITRQNEEDNQGQRPYDERDETKNEAQSNVEAGAE